MLKMLSYQADKSISLRVGLVKVYIWLLHGNVSLSIEAR